MTAIVLALLLSQTGSFGGSMPAQGTAVGAKRSTDGKMVPLMVDGTGALVTAGGGSSTVTANQGTPNAGGVDAWYVQFFSAQPVTQSGTWTFDQGTPAAGSNAWPIAITNTSDTIVKPGDSVNSAIRVNVVAGSAAGTAAYEQPGGVDQEARVYDTNGTGTAEWTAGVVLRATNPAGASIEIGTVASPLQVGGTVAATQSGTWNIGTVTSITNAVTVTDGTGALNVIVDSSALPTGAATETTLGAINTKTPALGQAVMASSSPVVIASNQTAVAISAASLPLPSGAATETTLGTRLADTTFTGRINTLGQKTMAASTPIVIASDQSAVSISGAVAASIAPTALASASNTGTCTSVTASTTVLASNASRRVAAIYNSPVSTANVHVKLGATATTSNPPLVPGQSLTIEAATVYTGVVDAIAASGTQTVCVYEW